MSEAMRNSSHDSGPAGVVLQQEAADGRPSAGGAAYIPPIGSMGCVAQDGAVRQQVHHVAGRARRCDSPGGGGTNNGVSAGDVVHLCVRTVAALRTRGCRHGHVAVGIDGAGTASRSSSCRPTGQRQLQYGRERDETRRDETGDST